MRCNPDHVHARTLCVVSMTFNAFRDKTSIISMINIAGSDEETISFSKAVKATGNIEDWLGALEKGMQAGIVLPQTPPRMLSSIKSLVLKLAPGPAPSILAFHTTRNHFL